MPTQEERLTTLEQGLADTQINFVQQLAENNQRMATLNRVVSEQMLHIRELDQNITILLGMVSGQERDIKAIQGDVSSIKDRLERIEGQISTEFASIHQQLATIAALLSRNQPPPQ